MPPHTRYAYFPFGAGPRICVGGQLGLFALILYAARLCGDYSVDVVDLEIEPATPDTVLSPRGLRARITVRT